MITVARAERHGADRQERRRARGHAARERGCRPWSRPFAAHRQTHPLHHQHQCDEDHAGGNAAMVSAPAASARRAVGALTGLGATLDDRRSSRTATCLSRCEAAPPPRPRRCRRPTYFLPSMDFFNGEAIVLYHHPAAHTDGDTIVFLRRSDVISTGEMFTPGRYPSIDVARGGSVQGLVRGARRTMLAAGRARGVRGGRHARSIPGPRPHREETDVAEFRDMVVDRPRPCAGPGRRRADARPDQGGEAVARLRRRVRRHRRRTPTASSNRSTAASPPEAGGGRS